MDYYLLGSLVGTGVLALIISVMSYFLSRIWLKKPIAFVVGVLVFEAAFITKGYLVLKDIPINIILASLGIAVLLIAMALIIKYGIVQVRFRWPERSHINESVLKKLLAGSVIVSLLLAGVSIYYFTLYSGAKSDYAKLENQLSVNAGTIKALKNKNNSLTRENLRAIFALGFYFDYACIVTESGNKYHRYGCGHIENRDFWIYNIEAAEQKGYEPCSDCWTGEYLSDYM